jgi:hypothetical protein
MSVPSHAMKISMLWAVMLAVISGPSRATVIPLSSTLFDYTVSASDVVGSGYIRFYGPTNQDYSSIFTSWFVAGSNAGDPLSDTGYPAYDSIEALNLGGAAGASDVERPTFIPPVGDAYTLLLAYVDNPICVGDANNPICAEPGVDIKMTLSSTASPTAPSGGASQNR